MFHFVSLSALTYYTESVIIRAVFTKQTREHNTKKEKTMKEPVLTITRKTVFSGVRQAAKRVGCTSTHLSQVLAGTRKSRSLMERLRAHNIKIKI